MSRITRIKADFEAVINLGNYESARCRVEVEKEIEVGDNANEELDKLIRAVSSKAKNTVALEAQARKGSK